MGSATDESGIPDGWLGLDVGPKTVAKYVSDSFRDHAYRTA